jgi:hypothetical protein
MAFRGRLACLRTRFAGRDLIIARDSGFLAGCSGSRVVAILGGGVLGSRALAGQAPLQREDDQCDDERRAPGGYRHERRYTARWKAPLPEMARTIPVIDRVFGVGNRQSSRARGVSAGCEKPDAGSRNDLALRSLVVQLRIIP